MILAELKALSNEKRLMIIYALTLQDFCQHHIIQITELNQVDASRNLKVLVDCGLVTSIKVGNRVIYGLSDKIKTQYHSQLVKIEEEYNYLTFDIDIDDVKFDCSNLGAKSE